MCAGGFELILQVSSTLWPDIKSQKLSKHRFRLKQTKCSPRTQPNPLKTGQDQRGLDKAAQDSPPQEVGGGWSLGQADRSTRPVGPTASSKPCGASS